MKGKNVGEWSELFALSTLLAASASANARSSLPKAKRVRHRHSIAEGAIEYSIAKGVLSIENGKNAKATVSADLISGLAAELLNDIRAKSGRTFTSKAGEQLANVLQFSGAGATLRDDLEVQWIRSSRAEWLGLSVKSLLGAKPTLLNASPATNFLFEIAGGDAIRLREVFAKATGMKGLFALLKKSKVELEFVRMDNEIFSDNLMQFSKRLPSILGALLVTAAQNSAKSISDVWETASAQGLLRPPEDLESVLEFLGAVGLGMRPTKKWVGRDTRFGGFVVVNGDGTVEISDEAHPSALGRVLFKSLKFEWGSRDRHKFGIPFASGDKLFIKLNLQLRFI